MATIERFVRAVYPSYRKKTDRHLELERWRDEQEALGNNDNVYIPPIDFVYPPIFIRADRTGVNAIEGAVGSDKSKIDVIKSEYDKPVDYLLMAEHYDWRKNPLPKRKIFWNMTEDVFQVIAHFPKGASLVYDRASQKAGDSGVTSDSHARKKGLKNALVSSGTGEGEISYCHLIPVGYHGSESDTRICIGFSSEHNRTQEREFETHVKKANADYDIVWATQIRRRPWGLEWEYRVSYNGVYDNAYPTRMTFKMGSKEDPLTTMKWKYKGVDLELMKRLKEKGANKEAESLTRTSFYKPSDFERFTFKSGARTTLDFVFGVDRNGKDVRFDFTNGLNPHMLVAGGTGSGKSVAINSWIVQIMKSHTPYEVQFLFIDPKRVEFGVFKGSPYCLIDPVTDMGNAEVALNYLCEVMDMRGATFERCKVENILEYHKLIKNNPEMAEEMDLPYLPYIVCVIDEMKDLVDTVGDKVQKPIGRLGQKARSMGIHLIIASQKPSVDWLDSVLKSNLAARACYRVADPFTSRTVIDDEGGSSLQGAGDCLAILPELSDSLIRNSSLYFPKEEINDMLDFFKEVYPKREMLNYKADMVEWGLAEYCEGWEDMRPEEVTVKMVT